VKINLLSLFLVIINQLFLFKKNSIFSVYYLICYTIYINLLILITTILFTYYYLLLFNLLILITIILFILFTLLILITIMYDIRNIHTLKKRQNKINCIIKINIISPNLKKSITYNRSVHV